MLRVYLLLICSVIAFSASAQEMAIPTTLPTSGIPAPLGQEIKTVGFIEPSIAPFSNSYPAWEYELLPADLLYTSYIANPKDSRLSSRILHSSGQGFIWALEAGARVGVFRYGTPSGWRNPETGRPEGWQLDIAGAAFPRLNFENELDVDAVDFRVGVPLTYSEGPWQFKAEVYHISSHLGDEFLLRNPGFPRLNYLRDALVLGGAYFPNPDLRIFSEVEYAWNNDGGSEPWHIHFGFEYLPAEPSRSLGSPEPFIAAHCLLREEVNFGGGINIVTGFQWRGLRSDNIFRAGIQYYNGESWQFSFFDEHEELLGLSLWYDF